MGVRMNNCEDGKYKEVLGLLIPCCNCGMIKNGNNDYWEPRE